MTPFQTFWKNFIQKQYEYWFQGKTFPKVNNLEDYYNNKYPKIDMVYNGRVDKNNKPLRVDVRNFFTPYDSELKKIVNKLDLEKSDNDHKALKCLIWVIDNINYLSDKRNYCLVEYWEYPYEVINYELSDCEGMSILLANLMLISGIPYWQIRITTGLVDYLGKEESHCFVTYFSEKENKWILLDASYNPTKIPISQRKEYKDETHYKKTYWSFNQKYCFAKDIRDIPKMENVEKN